ncbi:MAG: DUF1761 domain-containing protein [Bacteroidota bacterium]
MYNNVFILFVSALIPMALGFIYYHPNVLGRHLMNLNGQEAGFLQGRNKIVMVLIIYILSLVLSSFLANITIHQTAFVSLLGPESLQEGHAVQTEYKELMNNYGDRFRTFGHGAVHGIFYALFFVLPLLGGMTYLERRGWKYLLIHLGFWTASLVLMSGVLCQWL